MKNTKKQHYYHIENELSKKLASVQPKKEYVVDLRNRLVTQNNLELEYKKWKKSAFYATAGLVSFIVATILLIMYIYSFFSKEEE